MSNQWFQAQVVGPEMTTPAGKLARQSPQVKVSVWQQLDPSSLAGSRPEQHVVTPAASGRIGSHISAKILELQKQAHLENVVETRTRDESKEVHSSKATPKPDVSSDIEVQKRENVELKNVKEMRDSKVTLESLSSDIVIQDSDSISCNSDSFKEERQIVFIDGDKEIKNELQTPVNKDVNSKNTEDATVLSEYIKSKAVFTQLHESTSNKKSQSLKKLPDKSKKSDDTLSEQVVLSPPSQLGLQDTRRGSSTPLHSETIRIQSPNTPEQTLELTLTVSNVIHEADSATPPHPSTLLSPTQKLQFSLGSYRPRDEQRRGFVDPNILKLLPTEEDDELPPQMSSNRRSSEPFEKHNESRRFSAPINTKENKFKTALDGLQSLDSEDDEVNITTEDLEILSLKLEAVTVNANYLLTKTNNFCGSRVELDELDEEIERTQRALNDIVIFEHPELALQIALASRTLNACKMILEEQSPTIETRELGEEGRRRTLSGSEVRSVAMRVLKLNKVVQQERRGSAEFLEHQLRRGSDVLEH